jgi:hypothetical protein
MADDHKSVVLPPLKPSTATAITLPAISSADSQPQLNHMQLQISNQQQPRQLTMSTPSKRSDIANLMSPPDVVFDSFGPDGRHENHPQQHTAHVLTQHSVTPVAPMDVLSGTRLPSPPNSPFGSSANHSTLTVTSLADPILYPSSDNSSEEHVELFPSAPTTTVTPTATPTTSPHDDLIDRHMASRPAQGSTSKTSRLPTRADYAIALEFTAIFNPLLARKDHLKAERADIRRMKPIPWAATMAPKLSASLLAPPAKIKARVHSRPQPRPAARPDRVIKPSQAAQGRGTGPRPVLAAPSTSASPPSARISAAVRSSDSPAASRRVVAPSREDKDFNSLPNYCPPINTLPGRPGCLKIEWKGHAIALDNDPQRHLLHPEELQLAGALRLDCATYLTSKRRIFERRLECARTGKEFRKTDAQQACKIDVNKASKLWTAYERVGWLDKKWVAQWI